MNFGGHQNQKKYILKGGIIDYGIGLGVGLRNYLKSLKRIGIEIMAKETRNLFIEAYNKIMDIILSDLPKKIIFDRDLEDKLEEQQEIVNKLRNLKNENIKNSYLCLWQIRTFVHGKEKTKKRIQKRT